MFRLVTLCFLCSIGCLALQRRAGARSWPGTLPAKFRPFCMRGQPDLPPFHKPSLQSPINIETDKATLVTLPDLQFKNLLSGDVLVNVTNTGTTVEFTIADGSVKIPQLFGGPLVPYGEFAFDNLHIHWGEEDFLGGEHEINNHRFAIEGHCVHYNLKYGSIEEARQFPDGLAVVAFFGQAGRIDNPKLERLISVLPSITFPYTSVTLTARESLGWFADLGTSKNYFTYPGSLTTPPNSENVVWMVYPKPMELSSRQVDALRNLLSKNLTLITENTRPIQKLNGRPVLYAV